MKKIINWFHRVRSRFWNEKRSGNGMRRRFSRRALFGLLRGYVSFLLGRVKYEGDYRCLIVGPNVDFDMWSGGAIVMVGKNDVKNIVDPANILYPTASSVGVYPQYDHMNVPMSHPTRLRIKNRARLILEPNTCILAGCYLAVAHDKELRVGSESYIAHGVVINTSCGLTIGRNVMIGHESTIMDYDGHPIYTLDSDLFEGNSYGGKALPIRIEDNVWIGFKTTILKGVTIGSGSIIGANSCVTRDVPKNSIVIGNPARVIKENIVWKRY